MMAVMTAAVTWCPRRPILAVESPAFRPALRLRVLFTGNFLNPLFGFGRSLGRVRREHLIGQALRHRQIGGVIAKLGGLVTPKRLKHGVQIFPAIAGAVRALEVTCLIVSCLPQDSLRRLVATASFK